jgi:isoleucyl-tRNA synthetase
MIINKKISVHLQDYPDLSFIKSDDELSKNMDLVRSICSTALSIRDDKNLRVRLPLSELIIIGTEAKKTLNFFDIITDEVNVKNIKIIDDISDYADLKIQINFKKIGAKFKEKIKEITNAVKENNWRRISQNEIRVFLKDDEISLFDDDFEIKLAIKNIDEKKFSSAALPSNDLIISLKTEITADLENEGIARDVIRAIQQNRKEANFDISDFINIKIFTKEPKIKGAIEIFSDYICSQILAKNISFVDENYQKNSQELLFDDNIEDGNLAVFIVKQS